MNDNTPPEFQSRPYFTEQEDHSDTEATAFVEVFGNPVPPPAHADDEPPMPSEPPPMPMDPMDRPHTRENLAMKTIDEDAAPPAPKIRRQPAPRRKRPTLMPKNMPDRVSGLQSQSVLQPVRSRKDSARPDIGSTNRESSDIVSTFDPSLGRAQPRPIKINEAPRKPRRELRRKPQSVRRPEAQHRRPPPSRSIQPAPARAAPSFLPLSAESLSMTISDQRRRLQVLDAFARALELCGGVLGTLALAVLIAALVSIMVGSDVSVLNASAALVGAAAALGTTLLMVVSAVALRQLAHVSAQVAALLDALSQRR